MWIKEMFDEKGIFSGGQSVRIVVISLIGIVLGMCVIFTEGWRMPIFLMIMFIGVVMIFWKPYIGIVGLVLMLYFRPEDHVGSGGARIILLVSLLVIVAWLLKGIRERKLNVNWPPQLVFMGILLLWMFIITQTAHVSVEESMKGTVLFFKIFMLCFLMIAIVDSKRRLEIMLAANILGITYFSLDAFHSFLFGGNVNGVFTDNNSLGHLLVMFFPLTTMMIFYPNKWIKLWGWGLLPMQLIAIIMTFSRGASLSGVFILAWLFFRGLRDFRWKLIGMVGLFVSLSMFVVFCTDISMKYEKRMSTIKTYQQDTGSAMKRIYLWQAGLEMIKDHPITGVGIDNFILTFPEYNPYLKSQATHNTYFQIGTECGIPGLGLYLMLLWFHFSTLCSVRKMVSKDSFEAYMCLALETGMIGHMVSSIFIGKAYCEPVYWLIISGAILKKIVKEQVQSV